MLNNLIHNSVYIYIYIYKLEANIDSGDLFKVSVSITCLTSDMSKSSVCVSVLRCLKTRVRTSEYVTFSVGFSHTMAS